jgi:hypothetical protein
MDPLEMAANAAAAVGRYAEYQDQDPLSAHIARAGQQGHEAAQLAACMALVSIAQDLRRLVDAVDVDEIQEVSVTWADRSLPARNLDRILLPLCGAICPASVLVREGLALR